MNRTWVSHGNFQILFISEVKTQNCSRVFFFEHRIILMTNSKFQTPLTLNSHKSGLKNHRIKNYHIFGISRTSAFIWHPLIRGSVRSGSSLSPEGCNFSRFLESGYQWPNIFQLLYYDVVREDFTKKITWSPVLSFFTDALHHLAMYIPMLEWVDVETLSKVSNNHSGFSCVTLTKKYDVVLNWKCAV